jgi:hypothetical protein
LNSPASCCSSAPKSGGDGAAVSNGASASKDAMRGTSTSIVSLRMSQII